jgi:hypothetical protein
LQAHAAGGRYFGPNDNDVSFLGLRIGGGADFYMTNNIAVGGLVAIEFDRTLGSVGSNLCTVDTTIRAIYRF